MSAPSDSSKAVIAALSANLSIAVMKFLAFALTGASSMLAEAIHSVADSGNQVLLLVGAKQSRKEATKLHPFGYGRERYIYAFIVSIVLFSVGGLFALFEAYEKFLDPHGIEGPWWWVPLVVLGGAIIAEGSSFRTAIRESNLTRGKASWAKYIRTARSPELPVILLEDFAALIGLAFALVGVSMTLISGNGLWDAASTALIGTLLVSVAAVLAIETKSLLLGESATAADVTKIEQAVVGDGISRVIHLRTVHLGPEELLVAAKIAVEEKDTGVGIARAINAAEVRVRAAVPIARVIYLEPDIYSGTPADRPARRREQ